LNYTELLENKVLDHNFSTRKKSNFPNYNKYKQSEIKLNFKMNQLGSNRSLIDFEREKEKLTKYNNNVRNQIHEDSLNSMGLEHSINYNIKSQIHENYLNLDNSSSRIKNVNDSTSLPNLFTSNNNSIDNSKVNNSFNGYQQFNNNYNKYNKFKNKKQRKKFSEMNSLTVNKISFDKDTTLEDKSDNLNINSMTSRNQNTLNISETNYLSNRNGNVNNVTNLTSAINITEISDSTDQRGSDSDQKFKSNLSKNILFLKELKEKNNCIINTSCLKEKTPKKVYNNQASPRITNLETELEISNIENNSISKKIKRPVRELSQKVVEIEPVITDPIKITKRIKRNSTLLKTSNRYDALNTELIARKNQQISTLEDMYEQTLNKDTAGLNDELNNYIREFNLKEVLNTDIK